MLFCFPLLPVLLVLASSGVVEPTPPPEYQVKAQVIRVLLDYVEWPTDVSGRSIIVGVLEPSPFGDYLSKALEHSTVRERPFQLRLLRGLSQIDGCDVIFIPQSYEDRLGGLLQSLKSKPVLTIADTHGFGYRGVIVNLAILEGRTSLEINLSAMKKCGVTISPKVLRNATIIE